MLRAAVVAEGAGVPSVSLVCEGFERQAAATARGLGFDGVAVAVLVGHVDSQSYEEMMSSFLKVTVDQIIDGLTKHELRNDEVTVDPSAQDIVASGTIDDIVHSFAECGWSDGLPFIPPTFERVSAFLSVTGHDPWRVIGIARPSGRDMTVWSVAVNAVMAGCRPEQLPVLLAATEILADPRYGVEHSGNTTGADALMIFSGPSARELGFVSGQGALRDGNQANASVGRWLRLYLRNVCGFTTDEHDKATFGHTFNVLLAEDHEALIDIGWTPLASDFGFAGSDDVVTMSRMNSGIIIGSVFGSTPDEMVPYLADGIARVTGWELTHVYGLGQGQYQPLLVISPLIARTFARAGWSKADVSQALFEAARIPAWRFEKLIGQWSNLTAGRRTLTELAAAGLVPGVFAESDDPDRLVPVVAAPTDVHIAVAGDPSRNNAFVFSNDGPHGFWTSKSVDRAFSTDLQCRI